MVRARAGIAYALAEAMGQGHCGLPEAELLVQAEKLLDIPSAILAEALRATGHRGCCSGYNRGAPLYISGPSLACEVELPRFGRR